ncbi:MAG: sigma-70 family RNA polymerase sigma factor [Ruminococcaceae bacterium]|nr:sigma-70 family RNA polymerase sigma factor [Oscillospiraceae bacterium]
MKISDKLISEYAKKIYGFAFSKTKNIEDAEDLSQDILTVLVNEISKKTEIENPDGYIYRICCYTWSKYLRKNKMRWSNLPLDDSSFISDESDLSEDIERNQVFDKLYQEITYLSKVRREILIARYFDEKNSNQIAEAFSLSPSTVRWHLSETCKELKERLNMDEKTLYKPEKLKIHYTGNITYDSLLMQMKKDVLLQNICIVCYEKEMTIQEIARKLSVAAIYIEDKIERLVYMDYLTERNGKYRTNFHIIDTRYVLTEIQFILDNIEPIAKRIYEFSCSVYEKINLENEFGLEKNKVISDIVMLVSDMSWFSSLEEIQKNWCQPTKRKDGSEHWIVAYLISDDFLKKQTDFSKQTCEYMKIHFGNGIASQGVRTKKALVKCLHCDTYLHDVRNIDEYRLLKLQQIYKIIEKDSCISDNEKQIISDFVKDGLVAVKDGKPELMFPFIKKKAFLKYYSKAKKAYKNSGIEEMMVDYIKRYGDYMDKFIPKNLSEENRLHSKYYRSGMTYEIIFWLVEKGFLDMWSEEDRQSSLFVVWEE